VLFGKKSATSPQAPATSAGQAPAPPAASAAAAPGRPAVSPEEAHRRATIATRQSVAFAQIVSVLARSPQHKHFSLADLEWLVIPPLLTGQFAVAEAKAQADGPSFPVAVVLWASVSAEVDKRLSENPAAPSRLRPDEWRSGDILWLVEAVGDTRVLPGLLKQVGEKLLKGRELKMRTRGTDGKVTTAVVRPG
jgi:hemolysin-activating ACP:hemolysin acyltransferase